MNTARTTTAAAPQRLAALSLAGLLTLAMLLGVNGLAHVDAAPAQLAQAAQPQA